MKRTLLILTTLLAALFLSGCATLKAWSDLEQKRQADCAFSCRDCGCKP
jgi:hypothetical protein